MDLNPPMYLTFGDSGHFQGFGSDSQLLGLSLQEMIDTDIKADFDDITCSNNFANMESLELLNDIDFKFEEGMLGSSSTSGWSSSRSGLYESTLSNSYLEDMTGATSVMVNPNSVMPLHHHHPQQNGVTQQSVSTTQTTNVTLSRQTASPFVTHSPVVVTQSHFNGTSSAPLNRGIKTLKILPPVSSPLQQVPSPSGSLGGPPTPTATGQSAKKKPLSSQQLGKDNGFPKPAYSYSCLIALALKNSQTGSMSVSEIYKFMCEHFPYFKTAPSGWKNSVRHNLSLNKCFEKIEKPTTSGNQRKGCLWAMNPAKITKMDEEVAKWSRKDPQGIKKGMLMPETLESLERGELVKDYSSGSNGVESEDDDDPRTPTSVSSQGSQGYDSAGSDFVDVEGFTAIPDSSLPELNLQASGGIFEELESTNASFFHANYSIASVIPADQKPFNTLILHKQEGQKIFSI